MIESKELKIKKFRERAEDLIHETRILQGTKSANILMDIFGLDENFTKIKKKRLGQQIELHFPEQKRSITITNVNRREDFKAEAKTAENPIAKIIFNVEFKKALKIIAKVINSKRTLMGLMSAGLYLLPRLLTRKVKVEGSLFGAIAGLRPIMIGKSPHYKEKY